MAGCFSRRERFPRWEPLPSGMQTVFEEAKYSGKVVKRSGVSPERRRLDGKMRRSADTPLPLRRCGTVFEETKNSGATLVACNE